MVKNVWQFHQFPSSSSSSSAGLIGINGGDLSLSGNDHPPQWHANPNHPQFYRTTTAAAASSGFPQQIVRPQNWQLKNGFHPLMRPSWLTLFSLFLLLLLLLHIYIYNIKFFLFLFGCCAHPILSFQCCN